MNEFIYNYVLIALALIYLTNYIRSIIGNTVLFMFSLFMTIEILLNIQVNPLPLTMLMFIYLSIGYFNIERRKNNIEE
jgi:hypothetical protein